jgi:hypothetical protein
LFTCADGNGNPCNAVLGIEPPSVAEYLYSASNDILVPLPAAENEVDFFENDELYMIYYHIIDANVPAFAINN